MPPFHKILVPTDFSDHSNEAIRVASELSKLCGAPLTLLTVYDAAIVPLPEGALFPSPGKMVEELTENDKLLHAAVLWARDAGAIEVSTLSTQGSPVEEILTRASTDGYDLIVMGTHGRSGLRHAIFGSVAEKVVNKATCAVLTVR